MDAISLLTEDHRTVEKLFKRFEQTGERAYEAKREIVERIIAELSVHAAIEEQIFYPTIRDDVDGVEDQTLESLEEHHIVKWLLSELENMAPDEERYTAKATVLIESVRHHVEEEEQDLFPKVRKALTSRQLDDMGEALARTKASAPRRPHPRSPDAPPANLVTGPAAALVDMVGGRVMNAISGTVDRVTGGTEDVVEAIRPTAQKATSSTRSTARSTASRSTASRTTKKAGTKAKKAATKTQGATRKAARKTTAKASRPTKRAPAKKSASRTNGARKTTAKKKATASRS